MSRILVFFEVWNYYCVLSYPWEVTVNKVVSLPMVCTSNTSVGNFFLELRAIFPDVVIFFKELKLFDHYNIAANLSILFNYSRVTNIIVRTTGWRPLV